MRRTTLLIASVILTLVIAPCHPSMASTVERDDWKELLAQAIDGISIPGTQRQGVRNVENGAETVFVGGGNAWPFSVRANDEEWLERNWLDNEMGEISRESLGLGNRSMMITGEQHGQSLCAAIIVMDEAILMTGLGRVGDAITAAEQEVILRHVRAMYRNMGGAITDSNERDPGNGGGEAPRRFEDQPKPKPIPTPDGSNNTSKRVMINPDSSTMVAQINERHMSALHRALKASGADRNGMPASVKSLMDSGLLDDPMAALDLRSWAVVRLLFTGDPVHEDMAMHRLGGRWRDGAVATSDLPRRGHWLVLEGDGDVTTMPAGETWLGQYEARDVPDGALDRFMDQPAAALGVYVTAAETDTGRRGLGVDAVIPGYTRQQGEAMIDSDLRPGDFILTVDGVPVESVDDVNALLERRGVADLPYIDRPVEIIRNGQLITVQPLWPVWPPWEAATPRDVYQLGRDFLEIELTEETDQRRQLEVGVGLLILEAAEAVFEDYAYSGISDDLVSGALMAVEHADGVEARERVLDLMIERARSDSQREIALMRRAKEHIRAAEYDVMRELLQETETRLSREINEVLIRELGEDFDDADEETLQQLVKDHANGTIFEIQKLHCIALARSGQSGELFERLDGVVPYAREPMEFYYESLINLMYAGRLDDAAKIADRVLADENTPDEVRTIVEGFRQRVDAMMSD